MTTFFNKLKVLVAAVMAFSFFMAVSFSSCTPKEKSDAADSESVEVEEASSESDEHPSEGGEEHPSDSTATGGEHPEGSEGGEHPDNSEEEETSGS